MNRKLKYLVAALVAVVIALTTAATANAETPDAKHASPNVGWLHTDGTAIRQADGKQFLLSGAQMVGGVSPDDARLAQQAGLNAARLTVLWSGLEPHAPRTSGGALNHSWNDIYLRALDNQIQRLTDAKIRVILDFHQSKWSRAFDNNAFGFPAWLYPGSRRGGDQEAEQRFLLNLNWPGFSAGGVGPQDLAADAIGMLAHHFADNSYVVGIDMINEPGYQRGGYPGLPVPHGSDLLGYYRKAGRAIQAANPNMLVIYESGTWSQAAYRGGTVIQPSDGGLDVPNAVMSVHFYPGSANATDREFDVLVQQHNMATGFNQPFWLGEFTAYNSTADNARKRVFGAAWKPLTLRLMRYLRDNGVGWNVWAFQPGAAFSLVSHNHVLKMDIVNVLRTGMRNPW